MGEVWNTRLNHFIEFWPILTSIKLLYTLYLYDACCETDHGMHKQKGLVELIILDISFVRFGVINQKLLIN